MYLTQMRLHDFRSYRQLKLLPPQGMTVFVGENGAGKTNLLEAVHLCCLGRSHRTSVDQEMIRLGADTCAVHATVARDGRTDEVGVRLYQQQRRRKLVYVDGKTVSRLGDLMGHMTCVMFSPEDLEIIKGGPQLRRRLMDMLLSQCMPSYFYALQRYNLALKQRNALLRMIAKGEADAASLKEWEDQLAAAAVPIVRARRQAVLRMHALAQGHYARISGQPEEVLALAYRGHCAEAEDIQAALRVMLEGGRQDDIRRMATTVGPHRDDILLTLAGQELRAFGSQGQIRTAVLAMRLSEIDILSDAQGEPPILLLDDVLSELDLGRRQRLIGSLKHVQTLITCTDIDDIKGLDPACVLRVQDGMIVP